MSHPSKVQTEEQYDFIHDALLEATVSGVTEICRENLADFIDKLLQPTNGTSDDDGSDSKRLIDGQFEVSAQLNHSRGKMYLGRLWLLKTNIKSRVFAVSQLPSHPFFCDICIKIICAFLATA